jgi:glutathione synthase/RimK-type ligase-like ATP-grasp enzyme
MTLKKVVKKDLDNVKKNVYIYYSGPCRQTGESLVKDLNVSGGDKAPKAGEYPLVIGYGAKTSKDINLGRSTVLNHPNFIKGNRNKFAALSLLRDGGVTVAPFVSADSVVKELEKNNSKISLPLIGRRNYHQGGKGFHPCMTRGMVQRAMSGEDGAQYFQNFIDIKDEWRIHIFERNVIHAQKKVPRDNMGEAFVEQHTDKISQTAERAGKKLDPDTMKYVLEATGNRVLERPDELIRSNTRGWKFSVIDKSKLSKQVVTMAASAVAAVGLDFGAVDLCSDHDGNYFVLEVNTGPGLKESSLKAYVDAFSNKINSVLNPPKKTQEVSPKETHVKATAIQTNVDGNNVKKAALERLALLKDLITNADDDDVPGIQRAAARLFA